MKSTAVPSAVSSSVCGSPCPSPSWHARRARKEKAAHGCPKDTHSHLIKASKRPGFSCLLGIALFTYHPSPTSFCSSLLSQRQVVYWEANPSCWVAAMPVQSLPDFQSFFPLTYPALNFPVQLKANTDRVCQLVSNRPEKEKPECSNCSMFLCWINNTLKKTVTLFQGTFLSIKIHNLQTLQFFTYPQRPQQKPLQDIAAKIHTLSQWVGGTLRVLSGQNHCWLHLLRNSHFQKALQKPLLIMNRQEKKVLGCGSYKPWRQHM